MTDEIVLLSLPKIELKALIIDCLATVLEDYQPAPAAAPQNAVFDVEGLTQYAGLSKDTIYRKAGRGEIPHSKQGRKLYFEKSQIDAWLMANKVTPEAIAARAEAYEKKGLLFTLSSSSCSPESRTMMPKSSGPRTWPAPGSSWRARPKKSQDI